MSTPWKIGIIGGTGRIACAVVCELMQKHALGRGVILLHGRSEEKLESNLALIARGGGGGAADIRVSGARDLDDAVRDADIVLYNATIGLAESGGYSAFGVAQGAHILHTAQRIAKLAPDAWLLVDTNPPDVPLMAAHRKFGLRRVMGLCNASDTFRRVLSAYLGCEAGDITLSEIGVNHETWYLDILRRGVSVYDQLRRTLPEDYDPAKLKSPYLDSLPAWAISFRNNIALMSATGFFAGPMGGPGRFRGLPLAGAQLWSKMKLPGDAHYRELVNRNAPPDDILKVMRCCGGGISLYIASIISALLSDTPAQESVQVLNEGILPNQPETALLQVNCRISRRSVTAPQGLHLPDYVSAVLATRIRQGDLAARALAEQDAHLMRQALLVCPERVELAEAARIVRSKENVEPLMQLS